MTTINRDRVKAYDLVGTLDKTASTQAGFRNALAIEHASVLLIEMREAAGLTKKYIAQMLEMPEEELDLHERGRSPDGPPMALVLRVATLCGARLRVRFANPAKKDHDIGPM
jgi:hypothetical protein